jgi:hypothetical protein
MEYISIVVGFKLLLIIYSFFKEEYKRGINPDYPLLARKWEKSHRTLEEEMFFGIRVGSG